MFDINFYMQIAGLKKRLMNSEQLNPEFVFTEFEKYRSRYPFVYNIETTNACNMHCEACPRNLMTRPIETLDLDTFKRIIEQIKPFSEREWLAWEEFVKKEYGILKDEAGENHFFLYIIPKVVVLHGYGEPVLDRYLAQRIELLSKRGMPSYFSSHCANIDPEKAVSLFDRGLGYLKFSGDSFQCNGFYKKMANLLKIKKIFGYKNKIIISMVDLRKPEQEEEWKRLNEVFCSEDVYLYRKSQDQRWYRDNKEESRALHWQEFCQFPWTSMSIQSDGKVVACCGDYNSQLVLGDSKKDSLYSIWNSPEYRKFREKHFFPTEEFKCTKDCDRQTVGEMYRDLKRVLI